MNNINSINKQKLEAIKSLKADTIAKTLRELYNKSMDSIFNNNTEDFLKELKAYNEIMANANTSELDKINNEWLYYQMNEKNHAKAWELNKELAIQKDKYSFLYFNHVLEHLNNFNINFEFMIDYLNMKGTKRNQLLDKKIKIANDLIKEIEDNSIYLENAKKCFPRALELYKKVLKQFNEYTGLFNKNRNEEDNTYIKLGILKINGLDFESLANEVSK